MRVPDNSPVRGFFESGAGHNDLLILFYGPESRTLDEPMRDGAG
jgi:hypothetical protein